MARNIEIKAQAPDLEALLQRALAIAGARGPEVIDQDDTFFIVPNGRLKLRQFADHSAELIAYERPDLGGPKVSDYVRVPVPDAGALREALTRSLGQLGRVIKRRRLVLIGATRIHLDEVQGLGTFLERADNTARLLDVKYHSLLPKAEGLTSSTDFYQWGALLRSVSAFETYRHVYRDVITPYKVAELLILNADMPRSLHACLDEINGILGEVASIHSAEAARQAGELHATLHYGRMDDIFDAGLHPWLERFLVRVNRLGDSIGENFLVPVAA